MASAIYINDNLFEINGIQGASMSPALSPTYKETGSMDLLLWQKRRRTKDIQRGEVVHFKNPIRPEVLTVKRVIGLPGDRVVLDGRRRPRGNERDADPPAAQAWDAWRGVAIVPEGHVWVEGDNWRESLDSNNYGPISKNLITGRAIAVVWPPERFWARPWEGFKSRTKILNAAGNRKHWTEGLPVELAEVGESPIPR